MNISLKNIGKRYNQEWIFRGVNHEFKVGEHCVLLGSNGSGKSTLLQVIHGNFTESEGEISYTLNEQELQKEEVFKHTSIATPYLELIEEFTLEEQLKFHSRFKTYIDNLGIEELINLMWLEKGKNKELKYFSSGMKQRVKLALAILSDTPLVLLDEPTSNLDKEGVNWYKELVQKYSDNRLFIVCSNQQKDEYFFCSEKLQIEDYK